MKTVAALSTVLMILVVALVTLAMVSATLPWTPAAVNRAGMLSDEGPTAVALLLRERQP